MNFAILGERVKDLRISANLKQSDLSREIFRKTGITLSESTISDIENIDEKNKMPGIDKVVAIANFFDVSVDYLIGKNECKELSNEAIHQATGLSEKSILALREYKRFNNSGSLTVEDAKETAIFYKHLTNKSTDECSNEDNIEQWEEDAYEDTIGQWMDIFSKIYQQYQNVIDFINAVISLDFLLVEKDDFVGLRDLSQAYAICLKRYKAYKLDNSHARLDLNEDFNIALFIFQKKCTDFIMRQCNLAVKEEHFGNSTKTR